MDVNEFMSIMGGFLETVLQYEGWRIADTDAVTSKIVVDEKKQVLKFLKSVISPLKWSTSATGRRPRKLSSA